MNAILILVGLLVLSYLGSFLVGGRSVRGVGLPSGVEYAALGFVLGPHALGLVGGDNLAAFEPVVQVALGWLAFVIGLDFGFVGEKRVRVGSLVLGSLSALLAGGAAASAVWFTMDRLGIGGSMTERILVAGGTGAACSQTTRHAIRWIVDRHDGRGPLADRINELAHTDDFLPLVAVSVLFALEPARDVAMKVPLRDWPAITIGLGLMMGAGAALLLRIEMPIEDTWAVLFGVSLIAIGTATRLAISTLTVCFFMGIAVSMLTAHGTSSGEWSGRPRGRSSFPRSSSPARGSISARRRRCPGSRRRPSPAASWRRSSRAGCSRPARGRRARQARSSGSR